MRTEESLDRISTLPDSIICHILSFLPLNVAAGTSVLSTRWKYFFASTPNLHFSHFREWRNPKANENFVKFVIRVMMLCNLPCINSFRLDCAYSINLYSCICAALRRNVRELDFDFSIPMGTHLCLPGDLFTCKTLVVMKLRFPGVLNLPYNVHLPNLKSLHLSDIEFPDNLFHRFISNCPVLEDLVIVGCHFDFDIIIDISCPQLKSFTIDWHADLKMYESNEYYEYELVMNVPNLLRFKYIGLIPKGYSVKNLQSLLNAYIGMGYICCYDSYEEGDLDQKESLSEVFRGISNVPFLHLLSDCIYAIICLNVGLPTFSNLTHLEIGDAFLKCHAWKKLPGLLECMPILEALVFEHDISRSMCVPEKCEEGEGECECGNYIECGFEDGQSQHVPMCLLFKLKTLEMKYFKDTEGEMKMFDYLLKNARVLKKCTIQTPASWTDKKRWELSKRLLVLQRGSNECQVVIS